MRFDGVERSPYFKSKNGGEAGGQSKILRSLFIFLIIIVAIFLVYFFIFKGEITSTNKSVRIQIDFPEEVVVGKETTFLISVFNQEQADLLDAELFINFPAGFKLSSAEPSCSNLSSAGCFINFPRIKNKTLKDVKITGKFFNSINEQVQLNTRLSFQLENFSSWFKKEASQEIAFENPDANLEIDGPSELIAAEEGNFRVKAISYEDEPLSLAVVISLSENFNFINLSPSYNDKRDEKIIWQFNFDSNDEKVIDFSGYFNEKDSKGEILVRAGIFDDDNNFFPQIEKEHLVKINKPGLVLGLKANGVFEENLIQNFGDNVLLNLSYRNIGQEKIFEPVFKIEVTPSQLIEVEKNTDWLWLIEGNNIALESSKIETEDNRQIIIFSSSRKTEIEPGEEGEIKIDFKIRNKEILSAEQLLNSSIIVKTESSAKIFRRQPMIFNVQSNEIRINLE